MRNSNTGRRAKAGTKRLQNLTGICTATGVGVLGRFPLALRRSSLHISHILWWLGGGCMTAFIEMGWPDIHWLARDLGWAGGSHCLSLDRKLSMPLEPKLAPCGWRCPHRRPALTGPFGNW